MLEPNFAVYFGPEGEDEFIGFTADNGFFAILTCEEGLSRENGQELLKKLSSEISKHPINNLNQFEEFIIEKLRHSNIPADNSLACGYLKDEKCFLKTSGLGQIYIKRERNFSKLIERDNSASGFIRDGDLLVFTTQFFLSLVGDEKRLHGFIGNKKPEEIRESLTPILKAQDDEMAIALFASFSTQVQEPDSQESYVQERTTPLINYDKQKLLRFGAIAVIAVFLLWSIVAGYQRRAGSKIEKDLKLKTELINEELSQAEEVAFLNLGRAQALFAEAKKNLSDLKKEAGEQKRGEIEALDKLIRDRESKIFNREEKQFAEFFDLSVEDKNIKGTKLFLDKDNLAILDKNHAIYILSLSKKSLDKKNMGEIKGSSLVGLSADTVLFFKDDGVYKIQDNKVKKVIEHDGDWGRIIDMAIYNSNLYLLDSAKDQIYKYSPTEDGFGGKNSYIQSGQGVSLKDANSIMIDSAVYVGFPDKTVKFASGARDTFHTDFPDSDLKIVKIFTSQDVEKVYAWDKQKGAFYTLAKTGSYERQIKSSILGKADDFVVSGNNAYILSGSKIYKMSLD